LYFKIDFNQTTATGVPIRRLVHSTHGSRGANYGKATRQSG
jgi:hypothetical protein